MTEPRYWRQLERHPLSAEYPNLQNGKMQAMRASVKRGVLNGRKVTLHEGKVLDGWQFYTACLLEEVKPQFQNVPKGWSPEEYVEACNDVRRHETPEFQEARANRRRQRVAELRKEGLSERTIAEEVGVSPKTVHKDLEKATATGVAVEPQDNEVVSKDGRKRPASTKPRKPKKAKPPTLKAAVDAVADEDGGELKDQIGTAIPPGLKSVFEDATTLRGTLNQLREIKAALHKISERPAGRHLKGGDAVMAVANASKAIKWAMPHAVCPVCGGIAKERKSGCPCKDSGWLPEDNYKLLPQEYRA